jgi:hypothetical protein
LQRGLIFRNGAGDLDTPALRFTVVRQGVIDLLPGSQNRLPEQERRFPLSCFAQSKGAAQPPAFEDRD